MKLKTDKDLLQELHDKGYKGLEQRVKAPSGPLVGKRKGKIAEAYAIEQRVNATESGFFSARPSAGPALAAVLRWRIGSWSLKQFPPLAGVSVVTRVRDFFAFFNPRVPDYISRTLLQILVSDTGSAVDNPYQYSLKETLSELSRMARLLTGQEYKNYQEAVRQEIRVTGGQLSLDFLEKFAVLDEHMMNSLFFLRSRYQSGIKVTVNDLIWVVRGLYSLVLTTEQIEVDVLSQILDLTCRIGAEYARKEYTSLENTKNRILRQLELAPALFEILFRNLQRFRRELFSSLLKLLGVFFEEQDKDPEKKRRIFLFLQISDSDILSFKKAREEMEQRSKKKNDEETAAELLKVEQSISEGFSSSFQPALTLLETLFPGSRLKQMDQGVYLLPYFSKIFHYSHPFDPVVQYLSQDDPVQIIEVFHRLGYDILNAIDGYAIEEILNIPNFGKTLLDLKNRWQDIWPRILIPYEQSLRDYRRSTETEDQKRIYLAQHGYKLEKNLSDLKRKIFKNYKFDPSRSLGVYKEIQSLTRPSVSGGPKLHDLVSEAAELIQRIWQDINAQMAGTENRIYQETVRRLNERSIVDFDEFISLSSVQFNPLVRQIKRYAEALYGKSLKDIGIASQVLFVETSKEIMDIYHYLLSDARSFFNSMSSRTCAATEREDDLWASEKDKPAASLAVIMPEKDPMLFLDSLTGVLRRGPFMEKGVVLLEKFVSQGRKAGCVMIDIDHFKQINDNMGHQAGDDILRHASKLMRENLRNDDLIGRYGGEEFVILTDSASAVAIAERIRFKQAQAVDGAKDYEQIKDIGARLGESCGTFSLGVCIANDVDDLEKMIDRADKALYKAKGKYASDTKGRNQVIYIEGTAEKGWKFSSYEEYKKSFPGM